MQKERRLTLVMIGNRHLGKTITRVQPEHRMFALVEVI